MRFRDLSKQLSQGNRLHKVNLFARKMSPHTMVICTQIGQQRKSLGLPSILISEKGMSMEEAQVIRQASAMRDEIESAIDSHGIGAAKHSQSKVKTPIKALLETWAKSFNSTQTQRNAEQAGKKLLNIVGDNMAIGSLRRSHLLEMMSALDKDKKHHNTVRYHLSRIRAFANWAHERGYCQKVDTRRLLPQEHFGEVKALTMDEIGKLSQTPIELWPDVKDRFMLGIYTVQRQGEIDKYTWKVLEEREITVRQGKTGKWIKIPLTDQAIALLESIKARRKTKPKLSDLVFSELPTNQHACRAFKSWLESAGINPERCKPKNARSSAITYLIKMGVSLSTMQEMANHSSPVTTAKYYRQVDTQEKLKALKLIPEFRTAK